MVARRIPELVEVGPATSTTDAGRYSGDGVRQRLPVHRRTEGILSAAGHRQIVR